MEYKEAIKKDLYRYGQGINKKTQIKMYLGNCGFRFMYHHRKVNLYKKNNKLKYLFNAALLFKLNMKYNFEISKDAHIGEGFYIGHRGGVVINPNSVIGKNVCVTSGVLIGQENRGKRKGSPTIGDNVWIGAKDTIVGNVTIGNNVLIAPNSFINFDVPNDSIVFGNPAKIKSDKNATTGYIGWPV